MLGLLNGAFNGTVQALLRVRGLLTCRGEKEIHKFAIKFSLSTPPVLTAILLKTESPFLLLQNICTSASERLKRQFICFQQVFLNK